MWQMLKIGKRKTYKQYLVKMWISLYVLVILLYFNIFFFTF